MSSKLHISADWLEKFGGAEKVVQALLEIYPESKVATLWNSSHEIDGSRVLELINKPNSSLWKAATLPFMPAIWEKFDFKDQECSTIMGTSHLFAHHVSRLANSAGATRLAYIHTPARYIWEPKRDSRAALVPRAALNVFRQIDVKAARSLDGIVANSEFTKSKILEAWGRLPDKVIYPPTDLGRIETIRQTALTDQEFSQIDSMQLPKHYFVSISRLVPYKRVDLAVELSALLNMTLVIIGNGPQLNYLKKLASQLDAKVIFMGGVSDKVKFQIAEIAEFLFFPGVEDFGIVPVEMFALGVPVVAADEGGAKETIEEGVNGFLSRFGDVGSAAQAARKVSKLNRLDVMHTSTKFGLTQFSKNIVNFVGDR
jgi:glycosyltransferase involved in cell wall biosynthesis